MTTTSAGQVFWADDDNDQGSGPGGSRFAAYVGLHSAQFDGCWEWDEPRPAQFAAAAWRIATGPVMAPAYVRRHRRVISAQVRASEWDESLIACVDLVTSQSAAAPFATIRGGTWRDWPTEYRGGEYHFADPADEDLTRASYLLTTVSAQFAVPSVRLPRAPAGMPAAAELASLARNAVRVLAGELSAAVGPVIDRIEGS